jgi:isochorismate hydrolase
LRTHLGSLLEHIRLANGFGQHKMLRNILALQQNLKTLGDEPLQVTAAQASLVEVARTWSRGILRTHLGSLLEKLPESSTTVKVVSPLMDDLLIRNARHIRLANGFGQHKMLRNILA